jgi:hypothetical protein
MTFQPLTDRSTRRHAHKPNGATGGEAQCPYCGQEISRKEFREIRTRIESEERARIADVEKALKDRFAAEKAKAETEKVVQIHKVKLEAARIAEQHIKKLKADQDAVIKARLDAERDAAAKKTAEAVSAEKVRAYEEKTKLTDQLADMQRRLEKKTAHELGEPAEVDLFAALVAAFADDRMSRVVKGVRGPDVIVEVVHNGAVVGSIVLDSKNHKAWQNKFTAKLRADQLAEGADFAILSSNVFPAGEAQICMRDNVIVASPQRVVVLVHLLRRQIVDNFRLKLSAESRDDKAEKLLHYIVSPTCTDLLDRIVSLSRDMADLDRVETAAHGKVWAKRADLIRTLHAIHEEFSGAVSAIIAGEPEAE